MITPKTLAIAETLVAGRTVPLLSVVSPAVLALNNSLSGALPITVVNYREAIPEMSKTNEEYTTVHDEITTRVAERVRNSFEQIRAYAKPFVRRIVEELGINDDLYSSGGSNARSLLMQDVNLRFVNVDHKFFASLYYPAVIPNTGLQYNHVSVDSISEVSLERWDSRKVIEWLNIDNPEINELFTESSVDVGDALCDLCRPYSLPFKYNEESRTLDFTQPDLWSMGSMFVQYIILSKMVGEQEPFPGLIKGSLEAYRTWANYLLNAYTVALVNLKRNASAFNNLPLRIVERGNTVVRNKSLGENLPEFPTVKVDATIYYNTVGLDLCIENEMTLAEVAIGYFYQKYVGLKPELAARYQSDLKAGKEYGQKLINSICDIFTKERGIIYQTAINRIIPKFILGIPELAGSLDDIQNNMKKKQGSSYNNIGNNISWGMNSKTSTLESAVIESGIVYSFLEAMGAKDACYILRELNQRTPSSCEDVDQRKILHHVVIDFVTRLYGNKDFLNGSN